jgi:hypothetical protein
MEPHPESKEYDISNDENWVEPGQVINDDVMLHELFVALPENSLTVAAELKGAK